MTTATRVTVDPLLLAAVMSIDDQLATKQAFVPSQAVAAAGMPPMDPSMMAGGGMPPGMPPMDPSMMAGGGMPPMDPAMMAGGGMPPLPPGMPPLPPGMPPMDPTMMGGGMPPGLPPDPTMQGGAAAGGVGGPPPAAPPAMDPAMIEAIRQVVREETGGSSGSRRSGGGSGGSKGDDIRRLYKLVLSLFQQIGLSIPPDVLDGSLSQSPTSSGGEQKQAAEEILDICEQHRGRQVIGWIENCRKQQR